jgi:prophage antirepressor-like protein
MKELLRLFDNRPVRMVLVQGEPWFVAKDIAEALGYKDTVNAIKQHCKGVAKHHPLTTEGGTQEVRIIPEPDLYRLIISSHLPSAERFERWIFEEVLPSIRKTGRYAVDPDLRRASISARLTLTSQWREHGADKPYHYINLTNKTYKLLRFPAKAKKADMDQEQIAELRVFEALESLKLIRNPEIQGYHGLDASLEETATALPLFVSGIAGALPRPSAEVAS